MKILVPIKQVAVLDEDFELRDDEKDADPDYLDYELNEWDDYSYETALQIMEAAGDGVEVIPLTVGPAEAEDGLRKCLAKGGERGIRVWSDDLEGADSRVISRVIAKVAEKEGADMVFAGTLASDHSFAATGVGIAAELDWAHVAVVSHLDYTPGASTATVRRELEGGVEEELTVQCPAVLSIQLGINEPRYASLRGIKQAKAKPVDELSTDDLELSADQLGESGAAYRVRRMFVPEKGNAELIEGTAAEQAARLASIIKEARGEA